MEFSQDPFFRQISSFFRFAANWAQSRGAVLRLLDPVGWFNPQKQKQNKNKTVNGAGGGCLCY
jgi:hypothetical protein